MGTKESPHNPFASVKSVEVGQLVRVKQHFVCPEATKRNPAWAVVIFAVDHGASVVLLKAPAPIKGTVLKRLGLANVYVPLAQMMPATKRIPPDVLLELIKYRMSLT